MFQSKVQSQPMPITSHFAEAKRRYITGERRALIFRDLLLADLRKFPSPTVLDLGCGRGIDGSTEVQASLAAQAQHFLGIEPDRDILLGPHFTDVWRCCFEEAPIKPQSVDVAYSSFVLEHIIDPQRFWHKMHSILKPGGVCWAITVDGRSIFAATSRLMDQIRIKNLYLSLLHGRRGSERYENYSTWYRANSPRKVRRHAGSFKNAHFISLHRVGQTEPYAPRSLRWLPRMLDRLTISAGLPGSVLIVRLQK